MHASLLASIRELQTRLTAEGAVVDELEAKIRELEVQLHGPQPLRDADAPAADAGSKAPGAIVRPLRERRG